MCIQSIQLTYPSCSRHPDEKAEHYENNLRQPPSELEARVGTLVLSQKSQESGKVILEAAIYNGSNESWWPST